MKILIVGDNSEGSNDVGLVGAFQALKCDVDFFDFQSRYTMKWHSFFRSHKKLLNISHRFLWRLMTDSIQGEFIAHVVATRPDCVFVMKGYFLQPSSICALRAVLPAAEIICFNPDNPFNTWHYGVSNDWIRRSISLYDIYFIWGRFLIEPLKRAGARRVEYLPFAFDPLRHHPQTVSEDEYNVYASDVAFAGSWDEEREYWISQLIDYEIKIWGNAWQSSSGNIREKWQGRPVYGSELGKVCTSTKIVLNFIRKQNGDAHNMRTFEIPAYGGFLLSTRTQEQADFFEEGKEMAFFSSPQELREKIDYYLLHDNERSRIAHAGYQAVQKHSFFERAKFVLSRISH
ncbi:MAG: glycosyltransferase [bacterium]|nr:glycosyltransferase [bacterium]